MKEETRISQLYSYDKETSLEENLVFEKLSIDSKIYLGKCSLYNCFPHISTYRSGSNCDWFLKGFLRTYEKEYYKVWMVGAMKEAIEMTMPNDMNKLMIATTFLFSVVEFYIKRMIGFDPLLLESIDKEGNIDERKAKLNEKISSMSLEKSFQILLSKNLPISKSIHEIDSVGRMRFKGWKVEDKGWNVYKIADRLHLARNPMIHGENHSYYSMGKYLAVLYILFYLHEAKEKEK